MGSSILHYSSNFRPIPRYGSLLILCKRLPQQNNRNHPRHICSFPIWRMEDRAQPPPQTFRKHWSIRSLPDYLVYKKTVWLNANCKEVLRQDTERAYSFLPNYRTLRMVLWPRLCDCQEIWSFQSHFCIKNPVPYFRVHFMPFTRNFSFQNVLCYICHQPYWDHTISSPTLSQPSLSGKEAEMGLRKGSLGGKHIFTCSILLQALHQRDRIPSYSPLKYQCAILQDLGLPRSVRAGGKREEKLGRLQHKPSRLLVGL